MATTEPFTVEEFAFAADVVLSTLWDEAIETAAALMDKRNDYIAAAAIRGLKSPKAKQ